MSRKLLVQADRPQARPGAETWQLIVPYGRWEHPDYGAVDNSPERIQRYVEHFRAGVKLQGDEGDRKLPFTIDHKDELGASGWIRDVRIGERGLEALVRWTPRGIEAITDEEYPFISPDVVDLYENSKTGEEFEDVLAGASLVVRPWFKDMPQVYLEHYSERPEPTTLWADPDHPEDPIMTVPDTEHTDGQAAEDTAAEASDTSAAVSAEADVGTDADDTAGEDTQATEDDTAGDGEVDVKQFAEMRDELGALRREQRTRQFSDELGGHSFGDKRRLAPVARDQLAEQLAKLPPAQAAAIAEAIKAMRFFEPGEVGFDPDTSAGETKTFSEEDASVARQLNLTEEDYEA